MGKCKRIICREHECNKTWNGADGSTWLGTSMELMGPPFVFAINKGEG